jgi:hypothetical protein
MTAHQFLSYVRSPGHRLQARGGQLDPERDPVEAAADLHNRARVFGPGQRDARRHSASTVLAAASPPPPWFGVWYAKTQSRLSAVSPSNRVINPRFAPP